MSNRIIRGTLTPRTASLFEVPGTGEIEPAPAWRCKQCGQIYWDQRDAEECAKAPSGSILKPGTVVIVAEGYTWYDGPFEWVVSPNKPDGYKFHDKPTYRFYYVLGVVTLAAKANHRVLKRDEAFPHRLLYHLWSYALQVRGSSDDPHGGWTCPYNHLPFEVPENQESLWEHLGRPVHLIGRITDHLL